MMGVETAAMMGLSLKTAVDAVETAVGLTMRRFFWCARKEIQDRTLFLLFFLPESLFVRVRGMN